MAFVGGLSIVVGVMGAVFAVAALQRLRTSPDQHGRSAVAIVLGFALVGFVAMAGMGVVQIALA